MQIITLINEKGGVTKTSQSIHIAAGLALKGYRVLLMDTDPQANTPINFGVPEKDAMYRLLVQDAEWKNVLTEIYSEQYAGRTSTGRLYLMPASLGNRAIPLVVDDIDLLSERLEELTGYVDFVIIDTSPTPSLMHSMFYRASNHIIIPTQFEDFSLAGLIKTVSRVQKEAKQRAPLGLPPLKLLGIQPSLVRNTNAHKHGHKILTDHFGELVWDYIALRTDWTDAVKHRQTLFAYAPDSPAAREAQRMVNRVYEAMTGWKVKPHE